MFNKEKKTIFIAITLSITLATSLITCFVASSNDRVPFSRVDAEHIHVGNHYIAKPATELEEGIREYWICCNCHEAFFDSSSDDVVNGVWTETGVSGDHGEGGATEEAIIPRIQYEYEVNEGKIKLTKYTGEYYPLIVVPEEINGVPVDSIGEGCFVNENSPQPLNRKMLVNESEDDCSTYSIGDNIENIEEGAFDSKSTFVTKSQSKKANWNDTSMTGNARNEEGNVYYDVREGESVVQNGIIYVYNRTAQGYVLARCLTQRKNVNVPELIHNKPVTDVGIYAFSYNNHIEKVTLSERIGHIYANAFLNCSSLNEVIFHCPNLSSFKGYSFSGCTSLETIYFPDHLSGFNGYAFSNCGTIKEIHMPASVIYFTSTAFYNTVVEKIYYAGTEEQWNNIFGGLNAYFNEGTEVICEAEEQNVLSIDYLDEVLDITLNTIVKCSGVITQYNGFYTNTPGGFRSILITDPDTNFSLKVYTHRAGLPFTDLDYLGKTVNVTGTLNPYAGELELANPTIEVDESIPKQTLTPVEIPQGANVDLDPYEWHYAKVRGTVESAASNSDAIFLEEYPNINLYAPCHDMFVDLYPGDVIEVVGTFIKYNQSYELEYDPRTVTLIEGPSYSEPEIEEISLLDFINLENRQDRAYIVTGRVTSMPDYSGCMYLEDENYNQLIVYYSSASIDALSWGRTKYLYQYKGDFGSDELTRKITVNSIVTIKAIRHDYNDKIEAYAQVLSVMEPTEINFEVDEATIPINSTGFFSLVYYPYTIRADVEYSYTGDIDIEHFTGSYQAIMIRSSEVGTVTITARISEELQASIVIHFVDNQ